VIREYSIIKARLTPDVLGHEGAKMDKIIESIDQEKRRLESEMERELRAITDFPARPDTAIVNQTLQSSEGTLKTNNDELKAMLRNFFDENEADKQTILVEKLRLLEKENSTLQAELDALKQFHESREQDFRSEKSHNQVLIKSLNE